jgi:hypothetical protein
LMAMIASAETRLYGYENQKWQTKSADRCPTRL